ncbi:MAG: hypothetical protein FWD81_03815 [Methanomassiliicoccaceae archaeon]|nr:hypothetical protein [Methanomassiliicoccaceae archaeon]
MSENRVDPTVAGLYLVGFITLFFGLLGVQLYGGNDELLAVATAFAPMIGIVMLVFAYMAGKAGNGFATALFAFIAIALFAVGVGLLLSAIVFYAAAVFFLIFAIVAFIIGAPKLMALLLILTALLYLFVGFFVGSADEQPIFAAAFGLFGLLAFIVSTYMAVALGTQKMPVI